MYAEIPLLKAEHNIRGEYGIAVYEHQTKDRSFGLHWHDYYTIDIVLEGEGTQYINHKEEPIRKGFVQLVSPTDIHGIRTDGQITILSVKFTGNALTPEYETIVYDRSRKSFYPTQEEFQQFVCYARAIKEKQQKKGPFVKEIIRQNFQLILLMVAELKELDTMQRMENKSERMLQYLNEHFRENPPVERMASMLQMSSSYFSTYFREETGKTYIRYLTELKLSYACSLLQTNQYSVIDICFSSGFTSLSHFNNVFQQKKGCSPSQYRKRHREKEFGSQ